MSVPHKKLSLPQQSHSISLVEVLIFSALLSTFFLFFRGYYYGVSDHFEQLPILYHYLDPSYCQNDFFINSNTTFGPRAYYVRFIGIWASIMPLPVAFFILTWLANFAIVLVTYYAAKDLFRSSDLAALLSCIFVMGSIGIKLGGSLGNIPWNMLIPGSLVFFLGLFAIWAGIRVKPLLCAAVAAVAIPIHPLVGAECGAIGLATSGLSILLEPLITHSFDKHTFIKKIVKVFIGFCILGFTALFLWTDKSSKSLTTKEFIDILGYFRAPHHYIPSAWPVSQYVSATFLILAFILSWKWWRDEYPENRNISYNPLIVIFIVLVLWCCSYIFVEVYPMRIWMIAQTFRLNFMVNWLAYIMIAGVAARFFQQKSVSEKIYGGVILLGSGLAMPLFAFIVTFAEFIRRKLQSVFPKNTKAIWAAVLIIVAVLLSVKYWNTHDFLAILVFLIIAAWFLFLPAKWYRIAVPLAVLCVLSGIIANAIYRDKVPEIWRKISRVNFCINPVYAPDEIALYAFNRTPKDAVFLTPPEFGRFRLTAQRAIVVDFKVASFQDDAMLEWKRRITDCYGDVAMDGSYEAKVEKMDRNYMAITKEKLLYLAKKYNATYAVLYSVTPVDLPVLFANRYYKLVSLPQQNALPDLNKNRAKP